MQYRVIKNLKVKTQGTEKDIPVGAVITMTDAQAARLVEAGKVVPIRPEVQEAPTLDAYPDLCRRALAILDDLDPEGEAVRLIPPETWEVIQAVEDAVNELWKAAQAGCPVWAEYQAAVEKWRALLCQAIEGVQRLPRMPQDERSDQEIRRG